MALGGLLALAVGLGSGYLLTAIGAERTGELDISVWVTHHRPQWLLAVAYVIDTAIGTITAICALVVLIALLLIGGRRIASVLTEIAIFAAAIVPTTIIKMLFKRARPPDPPVDREVKLWDPQSMPSGHTATAVAIVATICVTIWLARGRIRYPLGVGIALVAFVGFTRIVVGAHYLGDVAVGALVATGFTLLAVAGFIHFDRLGPAARGAEPLHPPGQRHTGEHDALTGAPD